jgi:hypothetical protein
VSGTDLVIAKLDSARTALIEAKTIQAAKKVADIAKAMKVYSAQQKLGKEVEAHAHAIFIEAMRRVGEMLIETDRAHGGQPFQATGSSLSPVETLPPTLEDLGLTKKESALSQKLASLPVEDFESVKAGATAISEAIKQHEKAIREEERAVYVAEKLATIAPRTDRYSLREEPCSSALSLDEGSMDWVITDPPYPREFLHLFNGLGQVAAHVLKPGGSLLCMVGQSYIPSIIRDLSKHLEYHWTLAYLTPGGQATQLFPRKVNTFWKPILWFIKGGYAGDWIGDVSHSDTNDNDKRFHEWGQSESGMRDLMSRFVKPGDTILDPFMGAGTTGVIALELGATFLGFDQDKNAFNEAMMRLGDARMVA